VACRISNLPVGSARAPRRAGMRRFAHVCYCSSDPACSCSRPWLYATMRARSTCRGARQWITSAPRVCGPAIRAC